MRTSPYLLLVLTAQVGLSCSTASQSEQRTQSPQASKPAPASDATAANTAPTASVPTPIATQPVASHPVAAPVITPAAAATTADANAATQSPTVPATPNNNAANLSNVVTFHIPAGTGRGAWNTAATPIRLKAGQALQVVNDDSSLHWIHTNGVPFFHPFSGIAPGQTATYAAQNNFSGQIFDHTTFGAIYMSSN